MTPVKSTSVRFETLALVTIALEEETIKTLIDWTSENETSEKWTQMAPVKSAPVKLPSSSSLSSPRTPADGPQKASEKEALTTSENRTPKRTWKLLLKWAPIRR